MRRPLLVQRKFSKTQLYLLLDAEYRWHEQQRGMMPEDYERGFLACLKHVKKLVKETRYDETI